MQELKPFFSLPIVLDGLFGLARRLFGIECVQLADGGPPARTLAPTRTHTHARTCALARTRGTHTARTHAVAARKRAAMPHRCTQCGVV